LVFSNKRTQKRTLSANESSGERILISRLCLCCNPKWVSHIDILLEADTLTSTSYFRFGSVADLGKIFRRGWAKES
jgi:hypothetical protein